MLRTALDFLNDKLNLYLKRKDPSNFCNTDCVVISGLMKPDGSFALPSDPGNENFKKILTLINLEEDRIAASRLYWQKVSDKIQVINPPLNINAYVLFSVFAHNNLAVLRLLSDVLSFFQSARVFDAGQYPHLNAKVEKDKPWQKMRRLLLNLHSPYPFYLPQVFNYAHHH
jgi:hypothetical protein